MTVQTTTLRGDYTGNGTTVAFTIPFYFIDTAHIQVLRTQISTGVVTTLTLGPGYSVTGASVPAGGTATMVAAPTSDQRISILRNVPYTQLSHYVPNDPFPAATHEQIVDLLTMEVQQLAETASRALTLNPNTPGGSVGQLPPPLANNLLGWNSGATALQNVDASTLATIVAYGTANADIFIGNGVQTVFNLSANPAALYNLDVSVGGVTQLPTQDYTWTSGTSLTFTTAPPNGVKVLARYMRGLTMGSGTAQTTTYTAAGAGALQTDMQTEMQQHLINVKSFGAMGNTILNGSNAFLSGNDDTSPINLALTYAATLIGATVYLPPGRYKVSSNLSVTGNGVVLTGPGEIYYTKPPASFNHCVILGGVNCGVQGITFMSDPAALRNSGYGFHISVNGAANAFVNQCSFYYTPSASVWVSASVDTKLTNNYVYYPKADGLHFSDGSSRFVCSNNIVIGSADDSIGAVWDSCPASTPPTMGTISGNVVASNIAGNAFILSQCNNIVLTGNYSYFSASAGITSYLWSGSVFASNLLIEGNFIYAAGQNPLNLAGACGIYVGAMIDSSIIGNVVDAVQAPAAYSAGTAYLAGQMVTSGGLFYICVLNSTGNAPPNATYWAVTNLCAINVTGYQRLDIKSNSIKNISGYGIWAPDSDLNGPSNMASLRVTDNSFFNITKRALQFNLTASQFGGLYVLNNSFLTCGYATADYNIYISNSGANANPVTVSGNKGLDSFYPPFVNPATVTNAHVSGNYPEASFAWTPTITSGTGTITTLGTPTANYMRCDGMTFIDIIIPITTNGTGAVDVRFSLPFPYYNPVIMGAFCGVEQSVTGKGVVGALTGSVVSVKYADGTYPGGNGVSIHIAGWYRTS